jgi:hypothetical protein
VSKKSKKDKPPVKVPKGKIGRAVFLGGQVAGGVSAVRAIKSARAKGDKLALTHGILSIAVLVVTGVLAARASREGKADEGEIAGPRANTAGK